MNCPITGNIKEKIDSLHWSKSQTLINASSTMNEIGKDLASPPAPTNSSGGPGRKGLNTTPTTKRPLPVEVVPEPRVPLESLQNVMSLLASALIVVVFTVFMLIRREDLRNRFISLVAKERLNVITHVFDEAGNRAHCISLGTSDEMMAQVVGCKPDIVCVSALPPFAVLRARKLYANLQAHSPGVEVFIGLWKFTGDMLKASRRLEMPENPRTEAHWRSLFRRSEFPAE